SSVALTYTLGRRLLNVFGGCAAAFLLATHPVYVGYSQFVRTESLGLSLCLGGFLVFLRGCDSGKAKHYAIAGFLFGIATAARFHFALASLPVCMVLHQLRKTPSSQNDSTSGRELPWPFVAVACAFTMIFGLGSLMVLGLQIGVLQPSALSDVMMI